jgi:hypothetical protein
MISVLPEVRKLKRNDCILKIQADYFMVKGEVAPVLN